MSRFALLLLAFTLSGVTACNQDTQPIRQLTGTWEITAIDIQPGDSIGNGLMALLVAKINPKQFVFLPNEQVRVFDAQKKNVATGSYTVVDDSLICQWKKGDEGDAFRMETTSRDKVRLYGKDVTTTLRRISK